MTLSIKTDLIVNGANKISINHLDTGKRLTDVVRKSKRKDFNLLDHYHNGMFLSERSQMIIHM
jgi:hypothetical protein